MYIRPIYQLIFNRLKESRKYIQVLAGPRQVGKTTLAKYLINQLKYPVHYASADKPTLDSQQWIIQQWDIARLKLRSDLGKKKTCLLILDEIQKIPGWSETVKSCWDQDTFQGLNIQVILLGSAPLLIQKGLTESLAGRFETIKIPHWSYSEINQAFQVSLSEYIYFGGYPGSYALIHDENRWRDYIVDSLIETTISRDILLMSSVDKPALLRRLFELGCLYSGQIVSLQKLLGQLQDHGNATTIAHYIDLLSGAGMLTGLSKYSGEILRQRASSPKLQVFNTALISAQSKYNFHESELNREYWGRLVESAVGAHLMNTATREVSVHYWRDKNKEVDFVLKRHDDIIGIEIKSGAQKAALNGLREFSAQFHPKRILLVGAQGIELEEFLSQPADYWF